MMLREIICFLLFLLTIIVKKITKVVSSQNMWGGGRMNKEDIYKLLFNVFFMPVEGQ